MVVSLLIAGGTAPILILKKFFPVMVCQMKLSHLFAKPTRMSGKISYIIPSQQALSSSSIAESLFVLLL